MWLVFVAHLLVIASIYAMLTMALNFEAGIAGLWDLGIVSFFAVGAYTYTILTVRPPSPQDDYLFAFQLPMWLGFLLSGVVGAIFAYVIGRISLRTRFHYFLIVTFSFAEVVRQFLANESWLTNGVKGFIRLPRPFSDAFSPQSYQFFFAGMALLMVAVVYLIVRALENSPFGRTLKAIRENEALAVAEAKDTLRFRLQAFVIAGTISAFAGPLFVWYETVAIPGEFGSRVTFFVWTALVLGGLGNRKGALIGAFFLIGVEEAFQVLQLSSQYALVLANLQVALIGVVLILVLRFRPHGLFPEGRRIL